MPVSRKRQAEARTNSARWLSDCPHTGNRVLRITVVRKDGEVVSHDYLVVVSKVTKPWVGGYDLCRLDGQMLVTYQVRIDGSGTWWCNCPSGDVDPARVNDCKHCRALKAALSTRPL